MATPTKIILDKQSDLILTNARIVGPSGIVKSDLPGLVDDLSTLSSNIDREKLRIDAILAGSTADLDQFVEIVNFVQSIDLENDNTLIAAVNNLNDAIDAEATARFDADNQLSSDLSDLQSYVDTTVDSAISTLTADLSTETAARISDVDAEESRAMAAEAALTSDLSDLQSYVDTTVDSAISTLTADLSVEEGARVAADASLTVALGAETLRAETAETSLATALAAEHSHHARAEESLTTAIQEEAFRAGAAESSLEAVISVEHSHHTLAEESLTTAISAEASRAGAAETQLGINIEEEESRATAAELSLTERLSAEESSLDAVTLSLEAVISEEHSHHTLAEESLTTIVSAEESVRAAADLSIETILTAQTLRIDAILEGSDVNLDTFVEVVNFINSIDLNNDSELLSQLTTINQSIQAEIDRATASENNISLTISGVDARVSTLEDTVSQLPLTDGTTLEFNESENVIRLKDSVAAGTNGFRTFDGLLKSSIDPSSHADFDNYTYVTKQYVYSLVDGESQRATDAETDLDSRLTDAEDQIGNLSSQLQGLPETDGQTIEVNSNNNTIRLRESIAAGDTGVRTFGGLINIESLPENNAMFTDYSFITRTYVNSHVQTEYDRATQAEADLANMLSNVSSNLDELTMYFEGIPGVDGTTIVINSATNNIELSADVAASSTGIRTFAGLNKLASEPSVDPGFDDLSLVTRGWVINQVGGDFQIALDAEISARIAADSSLDVRVNDIISNTDFTQIDSFSEIVSELSLEIARAEDAELSLANDLSDLQLYVDTTVDSAISELTADLSAETSRAEAAELSLENSKLDLAGGNMSGAINMGGNNITNVQDIEASQLKTYDLTSLDNTNISVNNNLNFGNSSLPINLPAPTNGGDATNKTYVDAADAALASDFANTYSQKVGVLGTPNGTLTTFTLTTPVRINSEMIYVNGLLMEASEDYTTIVTNGKVSGVEFLVAPIAEMKVRAYGVCNEYYLMF